MNATKRVNPKTENKTLWPVVDIEYSASIPAYTVIRNHPNPSVGKGLYAARDIPNATFICEYAGELVYHIRAQ